MNLSETFAKGFELYKKNFVPLISLCLSRIFIVTLFAIVSIIILIPFMTSGASHLLASPDLVLDSLIATKYASYFIAYVVFLVFAFILLTPFFLFPHTAGAVLSLSKRNIDMKKSFLLLKKHYAKLLINSLIYFLITAFLFIESVLLLVSSHFLGLVILVLTVYVSVRLSFWDIFTLMGKKDPLKASWDMTQNRFFIVFSFVLIANILVQLTTFFPFVGIIFGIFTIPYVVTSKAVFVKSLNGRV
ncbi:MAG: hypothetical protein GOV01_01545 [Candidatus Altiarchaeota archaeon]|nr:hypothetical protein [Candidatus Altiarchaeota archaeon]